ncbi:MULTISPECIES: pyridoxal 5'-phosphate synthase glutaminase subunit PdxT [Fusobacterium]|jgi:5'-phosphate synthase pdxT subunit|nr:MULTISPECIES: pyridoxal 5'-phosphate synthase glutaminase subunit PdxT [Fusobacterium]MCD7979847.1 pyridoxal 5'-phosphate synthase glutaminase subunit PdxT [Fusobacterium sp.]MCI6031938.1 pyridoxal 5'-phosphate synthase glutaminase subunit PdxT [Fusobacterium varium]MDY4004928.1 pyridoxal 5'-phosphate synthase glutaminase subunit PdxT [Fusobacterium varium]RGJ25940.1 pyridoxal 5'-phosphate synthase glutaminase subunit PdxT [Fusobacterium varium]UYI78308.1 MAG: pyridoxal 5'-phosphate synthas
MKIGILALQGAFLEHKNILDYLKIDNCLVKTKEQLEDIDGIILPGGESTAMGKLLRDFNILEPLKEKIKNGLPVFGTCSGMILLAEKLSNSETVHLGVMGIEVKRNAYGRQLGSFEIEEDFKGINKKVKMVFIRAPYVENIKEGVEILATVNGNITAVREKNMLAVSFHPELTNDTSVHEYFLDIIKNQKK